MILWLSGKFADALADRGAIASGDRDVYAYGMDILLSTALNLLCIVGMGALIGRVPETLMYLASFIALRSAAGGYHARSHLSCLLVMLAVYGASMAMLWLVPVSLSPWFALGCAAVSLAAVFALAPAPHENRPVSGKELGKFKKLSRWIAVAEAGAALLLVLPGASPLGFSVSLGMLSSAVSVGAARLSLLSGRSAKRGNEVDL